jgi:ferredoxin/flavodoxin---NADP+ reductase
VEPVILYAAMEPAIPNATLVDRREIHEHGVVLRVRPDVVPIPRFLPGQFVNLGLPEPARPRPGEPPLAGPPRTRIAKRSYSIASSALETDHYDFYVALVAEGRLTPALWKIEAGGRCWLDTKPLGSFTLERVPPDRDLVLVATGTGLAPYLSMLRTHRTEPPWRRCVLIHGVRHAADLGFREEIESRQREDDRFRYAPVVSRDPGAWTGVRGRVQVALEAERFPQLAGFDLDPASCHVFLCGNPAMIQDVRERLSPSGFLPPTATTPGNLHFEKYW